MEREMSDLTTHIREDSDESMRQSGLTSDVGVQKPKPFTQEEQAQTALLRICVRMPHSTELAPTVCRTSSMALSHPVIEDFVVSQEAQTSNHCSETWPNFSLPLPALGSVQPSWPNHFSNSPRSPPLISSVSLCF